MKLMVLTLGLIMLAGCASTSKNMQQAKQSDEEIQKIEQEMCQQVMCQHNVRVTLKRKDGTIFDKTFESMPVVQEEGVMVLAGQSVFFEADINNNQLVNLKLVDKIVNPEKTIVAKFEQTKDGTMMLSLKNPFDKHLRIKMGIMPLDRDELYATSSCPVIANGASFEMWHYPILQVWLGAPHLMVEGENMGCIE